MKVAILQFPGSNCDWDAEHAVHDALGVPAKRIWHVSPPGGDRGGNRTGWFFIWRLPALAGPLQGSLRLCPPEGIRRQGRAGSRNLQRVSDSCEAGLLPGALVRNDCMEFRCVNQPLLVENSNDRFNRETLGSRLTLPIAHGEGNYRADDAVLSELEANDQVLLRYEGNPNGSVNDIAGIRNPEGERMIRHDAAPRKGG